MSDAIVLTRVSKAFRKSTIRREYTTLKSEVVRWLRRQKRPEAPTSSIQALREVSLTVPRGKTYGLVGRNGSGKSTLLKLVTGIYRPTSGTVEVHGRISALLELGAGFHPDFSGRENIFVNGIILGMSRKEIRSRVDEIIEFSELGDFIDEPVRTYSSGMYARLAFAVATHVDPEILIIDEILSVGDEHFGRKSSAKMEEFRRAGKTILLVTHDLATLQRRCDLAAWLDGGVLKASGDPVEVVNAYRTAVAEAEVAAVEQPARAASPRAALQPRSGPPAEPGRRWGSFQSELGTFVLRGPAGPQQVFAPEDPLRLEIGFEHLVPARAATLELSLRTEGGTTVWVSTLELPEGTRRGQATLELPRLGLGDGNYLVDLLLASDRGQEVRDVQRGLHGFAVRSAGATGLVSPVYRWSVESAPGSAPEEPPELPRKPAEAEHPTVPVGEGDRDPAL
ncbi:MAG TPA: polysaccharide ABC transporter ATP-binding protein [Myxococcaceae bacterium]|nr:polysaccharide ABC transporter ATP-binding protein [Myxococcaceae bacterium]